MTCIFIRFSMAVKRTYPRTQNALLLIQVFGDTVMAFAGLLAGYWLRFIGPLRGVGVEPGNTHFLDYLPLLSVGTLLFVSTFAYLKVYDARLLLRPFRAYTLFAKGAFFWFCLFLGISLALKFEPSISRIFVATSCVTTFLFISFWRAGFNSWLSRSPLRERIVQRVVIVGWSPDADQLVHAINSDSNHPYEIIGYVDTSEDGSDKRHSCQCMGKFDDLESVLSQELVDIAIVADLKLTAEQLAHTVTLAERLYVQFKMVPSFFRIFVSSLHLQTISGVPVLGVEQLHMTTLLNAGLKRCVDIVGALVGLTLSIPVMFVLSIIIKRESPGPVIYRQVRTGRHGHPFTILKLRSMRLDAEKQGAQWAVEGDPRRLKIGAFMREWNLDELPQFWNVLIGDMSLVGPRPERPELIEKFEREIPHYNPRHEVRPGVTGWAQVNGLRGNTSLVERINYDLYYIENWSVWFDFQIMIRTFIGNKNAY
jgi:exopolysaccharide biosynthesis polyprenyl glycosylphosphotransferase